MAPIPQQILDEEARDLIDSLRRREKDLKEFQVPRLRECKGPLSVQQRLAGELRDDLEVFGKHIEVLEIRAEDVPKKTDRVAISKLVEGFREASGRIHKDMRLALLHSKKTIDAQAKTNQDDLFRGAVSDARNVEEKATDDAVMKAKNDVTDALRRTLGLMQNELERSVLSHQILEQSTATLRATSTRHDILSSATYASKQLITALEKADWLDRLLIFFALSFFVLVVLFILKQRILDRGVRMAFWWTRFIPKGATTTKMAMKEKAGHLARVAIQEEGRVVKEFETVLASAVQGGTQVVKEAISTVLARASSSIPVVESNSILSSMVLESSSSLDSIVSSVGDSLDSLSQTSSTADATTSTFLETVSETFSAIPHAEL